MDYKYIEQLLDKYFACETSVGEENVLKAFFDQEDVPVHLLPYRQLFVAMAEEKNDEKLADDFDARILNIIAEEEEKKPLRVKAIRVTMQTRLRPLYKAAAAVAVVLALGQAAQMPYNEAQEQQDNIANMLSNPDFKKDEATVAKTDTAANAAAKADTPIAN